MYVILPSFTTMYRIKRREKAGGEDKSSKTPFLRLPQPGFRCAAAACDCAYHGSQSAHHSAANPMQTDSMHIVEPHWMKVLWEQGSAACSLNLVKEILRGLVKPRPVWREALGAKEWISIKLTPSLLTGQ